jgi:hypothetical protein
MVEFVEDRIEYDAYDWLFFDCKPDADSYEWESGNQFESVE